ncbi:MAG: hypothetical protein HYX89_04460 [Chloroflexi bacterium]|nr:hypothetical protein [Chloroflexota bacterium]
MPLEDLLNTIRLLKERAQTRQGLLAGNEAQTRYSLIDPLLRALGWDTEDPDQVRVEDSAGQGSADYGLYAAGHSNKPSMYLEAKRLGRPITDGVSQSIHYCVEKGVPIFVVTDGAKWAIYRIQGGVAANESKTVEWDLLAEEPAEVARNALALWRPNLARQPAEVLPAVPLPGPSPLRVPSPEVARLVPPEAPPAPLAEVPLPDFVVNPGEPPPRNLAFPNGERVTITYWYDVLKEIVDWLARNGHLRAEQLPIPASSERYIVARQPKHPGGNEFFNGRQVGNLWVETHASASRLRALSIKVITACGQDPSRFRLGR